MKTPTPAKWILTLAAACAALLATAPGAGAHSARVAVAGQADVRVWVDGGDVFGGYGDVTIWVRADRDCYSTLFLVDTAGYIHVLYPGDVYHDGWLSGGRAYCYRACDLGLDRLEGAGIAYLFAVGSPSPFDYSRYGGEIFVGGFGYRVVGDPFIACREFYISLLPVGCRWDFVSVGFTRFYVREWVRYPSYLCYGGPGFHVRVGDTCRVCADVYASYRCNVAAPYDVLQPLPRFKDAYRHGEHASIRRASDRAAPPRERVTYARPSAAPRGAIDGRDAPAAERRARESYFARERARVVSTSTGLATRAVARVDRPAVDRPAKERAPIQRVSVPGGGYFAKSGKTSMARPQGDAERGAARVGAREKGAKKQVRHAE